MAHLGLRVNHRKISIATTLDVPRAMDTPAEAAPAPGLSSISGGVVTPTPVPPAPAFTGAFAGGYTAPVPPTVPSVAPSVPMEEASAPAPTRSSIASATLPDVAAGRRLLIFEDVEVRRSRSRGVLCRVTLSRDGQEFFGEAEGQETERSRIELAARATLQAISSAMKSTPGGERSISLEGAKLVDAFDREFVFVSVSARVGREPVCLTGSCEVRESAETSAVLSVLDATNRWVHLER
jgi:hypothetical protein